jgi:hypothetical protein
VNDRNLALWRTRGGIIALATVVLIVGTSAVFLLPGTEAPVPQAQTPETPIVSSVTGPVGASSREAQTPVQRTLLFQVTDREGLAVANVLLATGGGANSGSQLYLSPILLVPVPLPTPLQSTVGASDTLQASTGVSMLLGVRVDAAVALNRLALAALVDAIGGVPISVQESVRVTDAAGKTIETVPLGNRTLAGVDAATYALTLQPGESQMARMRRFAEVIERVLASLPDDVESMRQVVLSLGSLAKSTATNDELVGTLMGVHAEVATGSSVEAFLPVTTLRANEAAVIRRPLGPALVESLLPEVRLTPGESRMTRVVLARAGAPVATTLAATDSLISAGFTVVEAGRWPRGETMIVIPDADPGSVSRGAEVAEALGVPRSAIRIVGGGQPVADVLVLLGDEAPSL